MNKKELEKCLIEGYKFGKFLHKLHKKNLKEGYVDLDLQNIINNMIKNTKEFRKFKRTELKEIEEQVYIDRRSKLKVI